MLCPSLQYATCINTPSEAVCALACSLADPPAEETPDGPAR